MNCTFDIKKFCAECHVNDIDGFLAMAAKFFEFLTEANKHVNLTRIQSEEDYWNKHVADSIAIAKYFPSIAENKLKIADIGCGAGFPSMMLALAFPNLQITAIDSTNKKIRFVADCARDLRIKNLRTIHGRAIELARKEEMQDRYDVICARAVGEGLSIFRDSAPMMNEDGVCILYKTPHQAETELPMLNNAPFNYSWAATQTFELPGGDGQRLFLYTE